MKVLGSCVVLKSAEKLSKSWPTTIDWALKGLVALWHAAGEACQGKEEEQQQNDREHAH